MPRPLHVGSFFTQADARAGHSSGSKAQAQLGIDNAPLDAVRRGGKASLVMKSIMRKFKSGPKPPKPHAAPPGYFNNPIAETGPDKSHVARPPGFFDRKPKSVPSDVVPMIGDDDEQDDLMLGDSAAASATRALTTRRRAARLEPRSRLPQPHVCLASRTSAARPVRCAFAMCLASAHAIAAAAGA